MADAGAIAGEPPQQLLFRFNGNEVTDTHINIRGINAFADLKVALRGQHDFFEGKIRFAIDNGDEFLAITGEHLAGVASFYEFARAHGASKENPVHVLPDEGALTHLVNSRRRPREEDGDVPSPPGHPSGELVKPRKKPRVATAPVALWDGEYPILGGEIPASERTNGLDQLQLTFRFMESRRPQRTDANNHERVITARLIWKAIQLVYKYFLYDATEFRYLRSIRVNSGVGETPILNIIYGPTQVGKTDAIARSLYAYAISGDLVPILFVRCAGGDFTFESVEPRIKELAAAALAFVEKKVPELSPLIAREVLTPVFFRAGSIRRNPVRGLNDLKQPVIVMSRLSKANVDALIEGNGDLSTVRSIANAIREEGETWPYAVISDEDDASVSSSARNSTHVERVTTKHVPAFAYPAGEAINDDEVSPASTDGEVAADEDEETTNDAEAKQLICTLMNSCKVLQVVTATYAASMATADTQHLRSIVNLIPMTIPDDYVALNLATRPIGPPTRAVIVHTTEDSVGRVPLTERPSYKEFIVHLLTEYEIAQHEYDQRNPAVTLYGDRPESALPQHVSALITSASVRKYDAQEELVLAVQKSMPGRTPFASFSFNGRDTYMVFSAELVRRCGRNVFENIVRAVCHVLLVRQCERANENHSKKDAIHKMMETIAQRENFAPSDIAERIKQERQGITKLSFERTDDDGVAMRLQVTDELRVVLNHYTIVYAVFARARLAPFVVCVAGILANRQMTFKDLLHRYVLTHYLVDEHRPQHYELAIQMAGRICSRDRFAKIRRHLFINDSAHKRLVEAYRFYEFLGESIRADATYIEIIKSLDPEDPRLLCTMLSKAHIAKPGISRDFQDALQSLYPKYFGRQVTAIYETWSEFAPDEAMSAADIAKLMKDTGRLKQYDPRARDSDPTIVVDRRVLYIQAKDKDGKPRPITASIHRALNQGKELGLFEGSGRAWTLVRQQPMDTE